MPTTTDLLDMAAGVGQRQATFRFDLIDGASGRPLGTLHPDADQPPTLTHNSEQTIPRTMTSLVLDASDTAEIDALTMRVRPFMLIGGAEFALGTYVFTDVPKTRDTAGRRASCSLADLLLVADQPVSATVSVARGTNIGSALSAVLAAVVGLDGYEVAATTASAGAPLAWPAGTQLGRIIADLATQGGYFQPFMGHDSTIYVVQAFDPADEPARFVFAENRNVIDGSLQETDDALDAPNRFVVIDNANTDQPIVGVYDVPVSAPHSAANRGFVVPRVVDMQGIGTQQAAAAAARAMGLGQAFFQRVTAATPPDPRHDGYDVVRYADANWLEIGWSMTMVEGAPMTHTLERAYRTFAPSVEATQ